MNIVIRYLGIGIEGIPLNQFKNILEDKSGISVKTIGKGMLILSDNKLIKCVNNYYATREMKPTSKIKASNQCYYTQKDLDIKGIANYSCKDCHLRCINKQENKELVLR